MIRLMPSTVWPRDDGQDTSLWRFCNDLRETTFYLKQQPTKKS